MYGERTSVAPAMFLEQHMDVALHWPLGAAIGSKE